MLSRLTDWLPEGAAGSLVALLAALLCLIVAANIGREAYRRYGINRRRERAIALDQMERDRLRGAGQELPPASDLPAPLPLGPFIAHWIGHAIAAAALVSVAAFALQLAIKPLFGDWNWLVAYLCVLGVGAGVGLAELVSRYGDLPWRALVTVPAQCYLILNGLVAVIALYLIGVFAGLLGFPQQLAAWGAADFVKAILFADVAALGLLRASLFRFRVGDTDFAFGPSIVLDTLLAAADRAADRAIAESRAILVSNLMEGVSFDKASAILPGHCIALMPSVSSETTQSIENEVKLLRSKDGMPDRVKTLRLGFALLNVVGEGVLRTAVSGLGSDLQAAVGQSLPAEPAVPVPQPVPPVVTMPGANTPSANTPPPSSEPDYTTLHSPSILRLSRL